MKDTIAPPSPKALFAESTAITIGTGSADLATLDRDLTNTGSKSSTGIASISQKMLASIRAADSGVFSQKLNELVAVSKSLDPQALNKKGITAKISGMFRSAKARMMSQYSTVEKQIDVLIVEIDKESKLHAGRVADFDQLFMENYQYHNNLEKDVAVLLHRKESFQQQLEEKNKVDVKSSFFAQEIRDLQTAVDRIDKRVNDLQIAMLTAKQMAPEIRQLQDNARTLVSVFENVKAVTIPAWKNAFTLYLAQEEQKKGVELANSIANATNEAFKTQADMFRLGTDQIAAAAQRPLVDLDTVQHVQDQIIGAFEDLAKREADGRKARIEYAAKLTAMETQLIQKFAPSASQKAISN